MSAFWQGVLSCFAVMPRTPPYQATTRQVKRRPVPRWIIGDDLKSEGE